MQMPVAACRTCTAMTGRMMKRTAAGGYLWRCLLR
jgi:hypothetical protein